MPRRERQRTVDCGRTRGRRAGRDRVRRDAWRSRHSDRTLSWCATRRHVTGWDEGDTPGRRNGRRGSPRARVGTGARWWDRAVLNSGRDPAREESGETVRGTDPPGGHEGRRAANDVSRRCGSLDAADRAIRARTARSGSSRWPRGSAAYSRNWAWLWSLSKRRVRQQPRRRRHQASAE